MKITVVTGERGSIPNNWYWDRQSSFIGFPEAKVIHQYDLFDEVMNIIQESFESDRDLIILTYSEIVFNTVRLWVTRNQFDKASLIYMHDGRASKIIAISKNGEIDPWPQGMFNLEAKIMKELITVRMERSQR